MCETCGCADTDTHAHNHHGEDTGLVVKDISLKQSLFAFNDKMAQENRVLFKNKNIFAINMLSGDGAGKTSLLIRLLELLSNEPNLPLFIMEGDLQTSIDADRIKEIGVNAVQINTGSACHLDAHNVYHTAIEADMKNNTLLIIENVGNLVCPASFDLGEQLRIVLLSVAEGEEKPLKYPHIFASSNVLVISKTDIAEAAGFDIDKACENALSINPNLIIFKTSAKTGEGVKELGQWLLAKREEV